MAQGRVFRFQEARLNFLITVNGPEAGSCRPTPGKTGDAPALADGEKKHVAPGETRRCDDDCLN